MTWPPRDRRTWHQKHQDNLTFGERAADKLRGGMGSWPFVFSFLGGMALWAFANAVLGNHAWDPYPFILLNLFLSMLAGLQGAILLIAAKRQDAISGAMAQHDYDTNVAALAQIAALTQLVETQSIQHAADLAAIKHHLGVDHDTEHS